MTRIAVIGSGSYGTCLAMLFGGLGHEVTLWCRNQELAERTMDPAVRPWIGR